MILVWAQLALEDRDAIFDFIEQKSPRSAVEIDEKIAKQAAMLRDHPMLGRAGRLEGTRELVLSKLPYILAYRILDDRIRILRVLHSAREWPDDVSQLGEK
jgi:toxin ParE1/3/4